MFCLKKKIESKRWKLSLFHFQVPTKVDVGSLSNTSELNCVFHVTIWKQAVETKHSLFYFQVETKHSYFIFRCQPK